MGFQDVDILWEVVIQRWDESFKGMFGSSKEIDHLALGVGSGVGAACTSNPNRLTGELGQCFFQLSLDGWMSNL